MLGRVDHAGQVLLLDHAGLYILEEKYGLVPETVFQEIVRPRALHAVLEVALDRAVKRGLADQNAGVDALLNGIAHQEAVNLTLRVLTLSILGREPDAEDEDESAEGKPAAPADASAA